MVKGYSSTSPFRYNLKWMIQNFKTLIWVSFITGFCVLIYLFGAPQNTNVSPTNYFQVSNQSIPDSKNSFSFTQSPPLTIPFDLAAEPKVSSDKNLNFGDDSKVGIDEKLNLKDDPKVGIDEKLNLEDDPKVGIDEKLNLEDDPKVGMEEKLNLEGDPKVSIDEKPNLEDDPKVIINEKPNLGDDPKVSTDEKPNLEDDPKAGIDEKLRLEGDSEVGGDGKRFEAAPKVSKGRLDWKDDHRESINERKQSKKFPICRSYYTDYTPCQDPNRGKKYNRGMSKSKERHCPEKGEVLSCLIPPPKNYKSPFKWPKSKDFAWYDNIPRKELSVAKSEQNWVKFEGDRFRFPGGGTMFKYGADSYVNMINSFISLKGGTIRTALDTGCGVASFGASLLERGILTMSVAPRDTHAAQIQFALERGLPAMIGVIGSQRMPYPARAFDLAHCSRCLIPWHLYDGLYLIEIDRVLRPGGFWVLSGPPIRWKKNWKSWKRDQEEVKQEQVRIEEIARSLCWKKVVEKDDLAIWQKPINHVYCLKLKKVYKTTPICEKTDEADSAWYKELETCITPLPKVNNSDEIAGGLLTRWPSRVHDIPPRIRNGLDSIPNAVKFHEDTEIWKYRVMHYKKITNDSFSENRFRNVMDMNAFFGGFATALLKDPVWVMNVVPAIPNSNLTSNEDTLGVIYERGLIGTYQDWCEAFSTYPRTYDLIHASGVFSLYQHRCDMKFILLEMDRILRPEGMVIIRDSVDVLVDVKNLAERMRWKSWIVDNELGPLESEKILVAVKTYWTVESSH